MKKIKNQDEPEKHPRQGNSEFQRKRQKRLRENKQAVRKLREIGLTDRTIEQYRLGLSEPYSGKDQLLHENALLAPVLSERGVLTSQTVYCNLPGITVNPSAENRWMRGASMTYHSEKFEHHTSLLVVDELTDLWLTQQFLDEWKDKLNLLIICSTHPDRMPSEWHDRAFWERFERIYVGYSNNAAGDRRAASLAEFTGREVRRIRLPLNFGTSWTEFWQKEGTVEDFYRLLFEAAVIGTEISDSSTDSDSLGRFPYQPIDISTVFNNGFLYYPVRTLINSLESFRGDRGDSLTRKTTRTETVVVRSDRTIHTVHEEPAPRGTPPSERVLRLTDGTLIDAYPKASVYTTWSWNSIRDYQESKSRTRPLKVLLREIKTFLKESVWLPFEYDYDLLTLLAPVTYAQAVFQSVPMILVTGEAGSGKSALGRAMCRICANAAAVGQISAAAIARLIHETRGFVLLDDLESIGRRSKRESSLFNELIQALKLSYNKETSFRLWTDVSRGMRVERLNFFGVKMINNTTGVDDILGSRMLRVSTRKISRELELQLVPSQSLRSRVKLDSLRDELHTWTFENVSLIDMTYRRLFPYISDRNAEISSPLRVFAEIAEDEKLARGVDRALKVKTEQVKEPPDAVSVMIQAVRRLVREGYDKISSTHVMLEMKNILGSFRYQALNGDAFKWDDASWVGRQLRLYELIDVNLVPDRLSLFGKSLRVYPVKEKVLNEIADENKNCHEFLRRHPLSFCSGCKNCAYRDFNCPIMMSRLEIEKNINKSNL